MRRVLSEGISAKTCKCCLNMPDCQSPRPYSINELGSSESFIWTCADPAISDFINEYARCEKNGGVIQLQKYINLITNIMTARYDLK